MIDEWGPREKLKEPALEWIDLHVKAFQVMGTVYAKALKQERGNTHDRTPKKTTMMGYSDGGESSKK